MPNDVCCLFRDLTYIPGQTATPMFWKNARKQYFVPKLCRWRAGEGWGDRLPPGPALLAVLGLSLLGWAFVLVPLVAILHQ